MNINQTTVIGVMSGTSLDGVDLICCSFYQENDKWNYNIHHTETIPYTDVWITRLSKLHEQPIYLLPKTDAYYGKYLGQLITSFIKKHQLTPNLIASHGHTIFHAPNQGYTTQIGSGAYIYAETGIKTICDFRMLDVALGGQGAPLVPIGDELLFSEYDACLNLGGFSNISMKRTKRIAFDISPCNLILNKVANDLGLAYDDSGKIASTGSVNEELLTALNEIYFYQQSGPKSLGIEWLREYFWPVAKPYTLSHADLLATFNKHIVDQIHKVYESYQIKDMLVTGGGTHNNFLIAQLLEAGIQLIVPDEKIINYKEALIFAFLGVLRLAGRNNSLSDVTGAVYSNSGGAIWG
ncbi:MAG: anhydro-N-acetylmuramic acid kinase [Bacteroidia bacterium]|jgi:anhydro-N-acetylmuramic acid kinase|nr:anhydro-N-acetylmuramic acid kinase [Bacteroidia bacterium]